jgi:hypothetical protein
MRTKFSLALQLANLTITLSSLQVKTKQEEPVTHSIRKWSDDTDVKLQDCFDRTDWNMFWDSSNDIEEYITPVTGFINR